MKAKQWAVVDNSESSYIRSCNLATHLIALCQVALQQLACKKIRLTTENLHASFSTHFPSWEFWGQLVDPSMLSKRGVNNFEEFHRTELYLPIAGVCFTLFERCNTALNGEAAEKKSVALQSDQFICPGTKVFVPRSSQPLATQRRLCMLHHWLHHWLLHHCPAISSILKSTFLSCHIFLRLPLLLLHLPT